jgi:hypothetical protein
MKCKCGSIKYLQSHVLLKSGYITLDQPTCIDCRTRQQHEYDHAWNTFQESIAKHKRGLKI